MKKIVTNIIFYFSKRNLQFYTLLLILLIGTFLRFYNYPLRYSMGEETVRDAVIGIEGARQLQFPLTGAFSSLGPFTFGPWYAYQLIFFYLIFPFEYSPWVYLSIISIIYIFIMYKIGKILGGYNFGLVISFLAAVSPAQIISATHLTSHNNTNLFAALAIWLFLIIISNNKSKWWNFLLGFVIGVGMNLHFQMGGLLILPFVILLTKRKIINFIFSTLGVIFSFVPMLFFEINNHWFNVRNIFYYLTEGKNAIYVPNRWLFYVRDFWPSFWSDALGIPVWFGNIIIVLFSSTLIWLIYKKKLSKNMVFLIIAFIVNFILLRYYWGPRFFGYLNFLRPFVFIFTTYAILNLKYKKIYIGLILLPLIFFFSFPRIVFELREDPFTKYVMRGVTELEKKYPDNNFALYTCTKKYNSYYNGVAFTTLLLLELKDKSSSEGIKIGLVDPKNECNYPKNNNLDFEYPLLSSIGIRDYSSASNSAILESGWERITFGRMYDEYARWWFEIKP